jgi:hypothetical protein
MDRLITPATSRADTRLDAVAARHSAPHPCADRGVGRSDRLVDRERDGGFNGPVSAVEDHLDRLLAPPKQVDQQRRGDTSEKQAGGNGEEKPRAQCDLRQGDLLGVVQVLAELKVQHDQLKGQPHAGEGERRKEGVRDRGGAEVHEAPVRV